MAVFAKWVMCGNCIRPYLHDGMAKVVLDRIKTVILFGNKWHAARTVTVTPYLERINAEEPHHMTELPLPRFPFPGDGDYVPARGVKLEETVPTENELVVGLRRSARRATVRAAENMTASTVRRTPVVTRRRRVTEWATLADERTIG